MTVRYLRSIRSRQGAYPSPNATYSPEVAGRYKNGFTDCRTQMTNIIASSIDVPEPSKSKIIREFNTRISPYQDFRGSSDNNVSQLRSMPIPGQMGPGSSSMSHFPYFMGPMSAPCIRSPQNIKREPNSTANSNDSESDSDQSLSTTPSAVAQTSHLDQIQCTNATQQTWRPWWRKIILFSPLFRVIW